MVNDMSYDLGTNPVPFPIQLVEINGGVYVQVDESFAIDQLGLSTVKAMEKVMPPPDLPQPPLPGYVLVDINTFMSVAAATGALLGVSETQGRSLIDSEKFALGIHADMHKIILSILANWSDSIKKQIEEGKKQDAIEELEKAAQKQLLMKLEIQKGQIRAMEAYEALLESNLATQPVFVMGSLALLPTVLTNFLSTKGSSTDVALNLTLGALSGIGGKALTERAQPLGLLGAVMMYGVQVLANLSRIGGTGKLDREVPEEYAKKMLAFANSVDAEALLKGAAGGEKDAHELVAMVKVAMLALPLMLCYRFETAGADALGREGMTSQEMKSLLLQEFKDIPKDDIKNQLAESIQRYLKEISGPVRALLIERILAYVDSKPPLGDLLDGKTAIEKIKSVEESSVETFGV
jgi:hypothetical protein